VSTVNVRSIYRRYVVAVDGDERLAKAAVQMQDEQVGALVVMAGDRFVGILTERDLTRAIAEGVDLESLTASDYMTAGPASVHLDADVHEVAATMFEFGCRHLPVVTDDGERVLGMVSIRDLLGTTYRFAERP